MQAVSTRPLVQPEPKLIKLAQPFPHDYRAHKAKLHHLEEENIFVLCLLLEQKRCISPMFIRDIEPASEGAPAVANKTAFAPLGQKVRPKTYGMGSM